MSSKRVVMRLAAVLLACALSVGAADSIEGRVWERSGDERSPLAKALVTLMPENRWPGPSMTRSGDDGLWRIEGPLKGRYYVSAARPGYYVADADGTARSSVLVDCSLSCGPVEFELVHGGAVNGVVEDDQGEPLENVRVQLRPETEGPDEAEGDPRRFDSGPGDSGGIGRGPRPDGGDRTDDLGRFRTAGLRPGRYRIEAEAYIRSPAMRFELAAAPVVEIEAGQELDIRVVMQREAADTGITISGRISDVELSGRRRMLFAAETEAQTRGGGPRPRFGRRMTQVDTDGAFELSGLKAGRYYFSFWRDQDRGPGSQIPLGLLDVSGNMTGVTLSPAPTVSVGGRFELETEGNPRGVSATLVPLDGSPEAGLNVGGMDRDFQERVLPGLYRVRVRSREWFLAGVRFRGEPVDPKRIPLNADVADLEILLSDRFARIEGRVRAATPETAAPRYIVTLAREDEEGGAELRPTDQNGGFLFERVTPGDYRVCARPYDAPRNAPCALERRFSVEAGAQIELGLTLPPIP